MNPLLASAAFGFFKGLALSGQTRTDADAWDLTGAPLTEEAAFRAAPGFAGVPPALSAVAFAGAHMRKGDTVGRFADVFLGGLLYGSAFKQWGFAGAVASHMAHNLAVHFGGRVGKRRTR